MGFGKIFKGKRTGSFRSHKKDGTRTALEDSNDDKSDGVSSLGDSLYSETDAVTGATRPFKPIAVVETVLNCDDPVRNSAKESKGEVPTSTIYVFPKVGKEGTADDMIEELTTETSIARRRRIFEEDCDPDLAWDTSMYVDEQPYRKDGPPSWMASPLSCLTCM
jgi:hypothetical protein